jgi:hypothetical protein
MFLISVLFEKVKIFISSDTHFFKYLFFHEFFIYLSNEKLLALYSLSISFQKHRQYIFNYFHLSRFTRFYLSKYFEISLNYNTAI